MTARPPAAHAAAERAAREEGRPGVGVEPGTIYVVATPIGNLEDVTLRALRVLREVDVVAAEDTRRTRVLLEHYGIRQRVLSYHDRVESQRAAELVGRAQRGESVALVSDAGTPLVADPGYRLLGAAVAAGVRIVPIPGPSAPIALLSCAGVPTDRFTFVGFLPARRSARLRALHELADRSETLVFLEAPRRLGASLADLLAALGPRVAVVGRELTKRFEEVVRGDLGALAERWPEGEGEARARGEIVLAVAGRPDAASTPSGCMERTRTLDELLRAGLAAGEPVQALARAAATELGLSRREAYQRALELKREG